MPYRQLKRRAIIQTTLVILVRCFSVLKQVNQKRIA